GYRPVNRIVNVTSNSLRRIARNRRPLPFSGARCDKSDVSRFRSPPSQKCRRAGLVLSPPVKIGDAAWMETLRDAVTPECDGEVRAVGLLWAVGLEQAINAWAARRIYNAAAYDSA